MRQAILEVERKFCGLAVPQLIANAGTPAFRSLYFIGEHKFRDIYFDKHDKLASSGVWIRRRQMEGEAPVWEAKVRKGGTFNNSSFEELTDTAAIANYVSAVTDQDKAASRDFGLDVVASLVTWRKSWLADHQFKIVLDTMDFGHEVGEVELERRLTVPESRDGTFDADAWKRDIAKDMDCQIQAFMKRYHWAFRPGIPRGKLTAYFGR